QKKQERKCNHLGLAEKRKRKRAYHRSVSGKPRPTRVPDVGIEGKQKEHHAQHVLPLGCPSHGLDVYRMKRKEGGNHQAAPAEPGGALEKQKEQDRIERVQQHTHVVVPGGIRAEEFAVESKGKPGQGMPVRLLIGGKGPPHSRRRHTGFPMRVRRPGVPKKPKKVTTPGDSRRFATAADALMIQL